MAALLDTPSRVLRRVQEYEDMELPSLPSFQHDLELESSIDDSDEQSLSMTNRKSESSMHRLQSLPSLPPLSRPGLGSRSPPPAEQEEGQETPVPRVKPRPLAGTGRVHPTSTSGFGEDRIPSLSRSDQSATDNEATTPEGQNAMQTTFAASEDGEETEIRIDATGTLPSEIDLSSIDGSYRGEPASTVKPTVASSPTATPATIRYMDVPSTAARAAATPFGDTAALRDVTPRFRNRPTVINGVNTPSTDTFSSPRPSLDDKERRKSHVLTVLASASLPSRFRARGTPHPLRQGTTMDDSSLTKSALRTWGEFEDDTALSDVSREASDLTSDRDGAHLHSRGNTSVPNILLATGTGLPAFESRPDAIKIHKHLNMMNKQLLNTNADLAREAEEWREECRRLLRRLQEVDVSVDETSLVAQLMEHSGEDSLELPARDGSYTTTRPRVRHGTTSTLGHDMGSTEDMAKLQRELVASQEAHASLQTDFALKTEEHARRFAEICEDFESQVAVLGEELAHAKDESRRLREELATRATNDAYPDRRDHIIDMGRELTRAQEEARLSGKELERTQARLAEARLNLVDAEQRLVDNGTHSEAKAARLVEETDRAQDQDAELQNLRHALQKSEASGSETERKLQALTERAASLEEEVRLREDTIIHVQSECAQLQQDLASATSAEQSLRTQRSRLEADLEAALSGLSNRDSEIESMRNELDVAQLAQQGGAHGGNDSFTAALEERLDEAHREIGRLQNELAAVPARQTLLNVRDARISALESEKESLLARLQSRREQSSARLGDNSVTSTPLLPKALAALRTPYTPGPLGELSWLQSTQGEHSNPSVLKAQLEHLQGELVSANQQLDTNFSRLEAAGLGAVRLAEELVKAKDTIARLTEEMRVMAHKATEDVASLAHGRENNDRLEVALASVHEQMSILREDLHSEKQRLYDEKQRLQDHLEILQQNAINDLEDHEAQVADLRDQLRQKDATTQLNKHLNEAKSALERELETMRNSTSHRDSELKTLRSSVDEQQHTIDRLRRNLAAAAEREAAACGMRDTVQETQKSASRLRDRIEHLEGLLATSERQGAELKEERARAACDLAQYADDLDRQRSQCHSFKADLAALRSQQLVAIASLESQVAEGEMKLRRSLHDLTSAARQAEEADADCRQLQQQVNDLQAQHLVAISTQRQKFKAQVHRLSAQIQYLKAKYTRENTFRNGLVLQKRFLLLLVGGMSLNEQATLRTIASLGYEVPSPPRPPRSLRAVGLAVISLIRARRLAAQWRMTHDLKHGRQ